MSGDKCKTCVYGYKAGWYGLTHSEKKTKKGGVFYGCSAGIDTWKYGEPKDCCKYKQKEVEDGKVH